MDYSKYSHKLAFYLLCSFHAPTPLYIGLANEILGLKKSSTCHLQQEEGRFMKLCQSRLSQKLL